MKKELRQKIYLECEGHCGYCGRNIEYKEMQVDHIIPQRTGGNSRYSSKDKMNLLKNLLCTCRKCNHYKRAEYLEGFRRNIKTLHERLRKQYIFEVGINFGITQINNWDGIFFFEKLGLDKFTDVEQIMSEI